MAAVEWDRVLVLQTSFLGDTVLALPLLAEIKRRCPGGRLTLLCSPQSKQLVENWASVDEIIVDDKKGADRGWSGLWRQALRLRRMAFTLALTPHKSLRSALILYLARIPCRVGFRQSKGWFLFNRLIDRPSGRHDIERNLRLLSAFGVPTGARGGGAMDETIVPRAANDMQRRPASGRGEGLRIGLHPGSVWATKRWHADGFAQLVKLLKARWNCEVVIFGAAEDVELAESIQARSGLTCVNLAGKCTLRELPAALDGCDVFITNDSGPMHIAAARGIPTVALFCATTPELGFYPYSAEAVVLQKDLPCRPCGSHGGRRCPLGTEDCIKLILPEHALGAVQKLLSRIGDRQDRAKAPLPEFIFV